MDEFYGGNIQRLKRSQWCSIGGLRHGKRYARCVCCFTKNMRRRSAFGLPGHEIKFRRIFGPIRPEKTAHCLAAMLEERSKC